MNSIQYTVRGVPPDLDATLRREAHASGKTLNALVVETLKDAKLPARAAHDDIDWFIGGAPGHDKDMDAALGMARRPAHRVKLALDTNAYVALHEGDRQLAQETRCADTVGLPIVVLGELWFGFMNGTKLRENARTLERFIATPRVQVLALDEQTTRLFGETATLLRQAGGPIQQNNVWIAALCKQHGFALATRDRGFRQVLGLDLLEIPEA